MRHRVKLFASVCLIPLFGVISCGDSVGPEETLSGARDRWLQSNVSAYTMTMQVSCECTRDMTGPVVIRVRNGVIQSQRYADTGDAVAPHLDGWFPTVGQLFGLVELGVNEDWSPLAARYDRELGYPTHVEVPGIAQSIIYTVTLLKN